MASVELFHKTWGGPESLIQQLESLTPEFPFWARPIWRAFCAWLKPLIIRTHLRRTMRSVDRQAKVIGDEWQRDIRAHQVQAAVEKAQAEFPDAKVSIQRMPQHSVDAVFIAHPVTDDSDPAQKLLGFSSLQIRAPFDH